MSDPPDDLDALLSPRDAAPASDRREAVFVQTARVLARARLVRRVKQLAAVAAVFVAGGLAGWATKPERVVVEAVPGPVEVVPVPVVVPVEVPTRGLTPPGSPGLHFDSSVLTVPSPGAAPVRGRRGTPQGRAPRPASSGRTAPLA